MNEIQKELVSSIEKFRLSQIEPHMEHDDADEKFRQEIFTQMGELGLCGITTSEEYGGVGLTYEDLCIVLEEISKSSVAYAVTVSVSSMVQAILMQYGNDEQKKSYLPALASGEEIGAFCLSESHSGSDASAMKTTAKKTDKGYILNGSKMWISSAGFAKTYIVMAKTSENGSKGISAFIVRDGCEGFSYGKKEQKMGWRASHTREVLFENCFVPEENLISTEGMGFKIAMSALDRGRITIGAIGVGLAQRAFDEAMNYSLQREQFNQPIFNFQGLQWMLADLICEIEASRLLVYQAAKNFDLGIKDVKLASIAKMKATDTAMRVTTDAVQIHGGVGYTKEYPVERYMRDAKVLQIVEGTNQIQKIVIARALQKEYQR